MRLQLLAWLLLSSTKLVISFSIVAKSGYGGENQIKVCFFQKWDEAIQCKYIEKVSKVKDWLSLAPRKIEIRDEKLKRLSSGDFSAIIFVKELVIHNCKLTDIEADTFRQSLSFLILDFRFNELEKIASGIFNDLFISTLKISHNKIKVIETDALSYMQNLQEVYLDNNLLTSYDQQWFCKTPLLRKLHFENNSIVNVTQGNFRNLGNRAERLDIFFSFNRIVYFDDQAFRGMENATIGKLYLDHNSISHLNEASLININELKISDNKIQCLTSDFLKLFKTNSVENFEHNPYKCTCLKEIKTYFDEKNEESQWFKEEYVKCREKEHPDKNIIGGVKMLIFSSPMS